MYLDCLHWVDLDWLYWVGSGLAGLTWIWTDSTWLIRSGSTGLDLDWLDWVDLDWLDWVGSGLAGL